MSSSIPVRRTTRVTRTAALKDTENANARTSRVTTRAKTLASVSVAATASTESSRATAPTAASKAKANESKTENIAGKRKREVLVEVTGLVTNNKGKKKADSATEKGKERAPAKESTINVVVKSKTTVTTTRQPLRTVTGGVATRRTTRSTSTILTSMPVLEEVKEETVTVGNGMAVDYSGIHAPVDQPPCPVFTRRVVLPEATARPSAGTKRTLTKQETDDDVESHRVFKKRHTSPAEEEQRLQDESQQEADRIAADLAGLEEDVGLENDQWDDLDAEDYDDPAMVSEYVVDVFNYLKEIELTSLPNSNYMDTHKELDWHKRGVLVDWIIQVHARFQLLPESLFLCVNIMDRFLSSRTVSLSKLQLVGITCFFIAAKFEETMAPAVEEIAFLADNLYTVPEILKAERFVLKTIDWNLGYPNPIHYLRRVSKADDCEVKARTVAKYLLEIGCVEWRLIATPPSLLAAASLWLARLVLGRHEWTPNLAHYSSYSEAALLPTADIILNYILKPIPHQSLYKKYAGKRYFKSSMYMRQWALTRWHEGTRVALAEDLPALKADILGECMTAEAEGGIKPKS